MGILNSLKENLVDLELDRVWDGVEELVEDPSRNQIEEIKQRTLRELVELISRTGCVGNKNKLFTDLYNREKQSSTAIGMGIAFPHVRSMQVREFVAGIARSGRGIPFDAPDGAPVHLFFIMAAPPYDDKSYLRAYKSLATVLRFETVRRALVEARAPHEIIRVIRHST